MNCWRSPPLTNRVCCRQWFMSPTCVSSPRWMRLGLHGSIRAIRRCALVSRRGSARQIRSLRSWSLLLNNAMSADVRIAEPGVTAQERSLRPRKLLTSEPRDIDEALARMDGDGQLDEAVGCVVVAADGLQRRRAGIDSQPLGAGRVERNGLHALFDLRDPQPVNSFDHGGDGTGNRFDASVDVGELGIEIHGRVADRTPVARSC